uniref:SRCR domain-containing protein n=1 Tax=Mesocestoides corti TaxID=53468 RepID=A0A5K3EZ16_MESCO
QFHTIAQVCYSSGVYWHRHFRTCWLNPILCRSAIQWHARKIGCQPETNTSGNWHITRGEASVVNSDGLRLTCFSGF